MILILWRFIFLFWMRIWWLETQYFFYLIKFFLCSNLLMTFLLLLDNNHDFPDLFSSNFWFINNSFKSTILNVILSWLWSAYWLCRRFNNKFRFGFFFFNRGIRRNSWINRHIQWFISLLMCVIMFVKIFKKIEIFLIIPLRDFLNLNNNKIILRMWKVPWPELSEQLAILDYWYFHIIGKPSSWLLPFWQHQDELDATIGDNEFLKLNPQFF